MALAIRRLLPRWTRPCVITRPCVVTRPRVIDFLGARPLSQLTITIPTITVVRVPNENVAHQTPRVESLIPIDPTPSSPKETNDDNVGGKQDIMDHMTEKLRRDAEMMQHTYQKWQKLQQMVADRDAKIRETAAELANEKTKSKVANELSAGIHTLVSSEMGQLQSVVDRLQTDLKRIQQTIESSRPVRCVPGGPNPHFSDNRPDALPESEQKPEQSDEPPISTPPVWWSIAGICGIFGVWTFAFYQMYRAML